MGVYALTNSSQRIDQAVNAAHSGLFPNATGVVLTGTNQTIGGNKTFVNNVVVGNFSATGVSGNFFPANSGDVNLGSSAKPFSTGYFNDVRAPSGTFQNLVVSNLSANLNIGATGLSSLSVSGTGYIQNIRVSGQSFFNEQLTLNGNVVSTGNNVWNGTNSFGIASFSENALFQKGATFTGVVNFVSGISSGPISGTSFYQIGSSTMSGALNHSGALNQVGNSVFVGNIGANGTLNITGSVGISGGAFVARASSTFTTGSSASDRFNIIQNVDVTGDLNVTGSIKISSALNVTGNQTNLGVLTVKNTGYFDGLRSSGNAVLSGTNQLTGDNSLLGDTFITGNTYVNGETSITGNVTFNGQTGVGVTLNSYYRPFIVASGIGTTSVATLTISNFFASTTSLVPSIGSGKWLTSYSGRIGEIGLFLTGASNTVAANNNLPIGTFGKVFQLVNVGTWSGSGVWYPLGV